MKLRLYDEKKLELPPFATFDERVDYINKYVFSDRKYKKYYNITAEDLSEQEVKDIEKWWLGVKKVNQPLPIENIKFTIDYVTGYLLGATDYSTKQFAIDYIKLKKKRTKGSLYKTEKLIFEDLKGKILYENNDLIFFKNEKMEEKLRKTLENLKETIKNKPFLYEFDEKMVKNIEFRLIKCEECKEKVLKYAENIKQLKEKISEIYSTIKEDYLLFQETKDENCLESILRLVEKIKEINKDINYYKDTIKKEHEDYLLYTELIYKTK